MLSGLALVGGPIGTAIAVGSTALAAGTIGTDLALRTLTITCSKTIDGIAYFATNSHPSFYEWDIALKKTDILSRVRKIQQLSHDFNEMQLKGHHFKPVVIMCIEGIDEVIKKIGEIIESTKEMQKYQESIYFNTWSFRLPNCATQIETLKFNADLLTQRFDELEKMLSIVRNFK